MSFVPRFTLSIKSPFINDALDLLHLADCLKHTFSVAISNDDLQAWRDEAATILSRLPDAIPEAVLAARLVARLDRMLGTKKRRVSLTRRASLTRRREIAKQCAATEPGARWCHKNDPQDAHRSRRS